MYGKLKCVFAGRRSVLHQCLSSEVGSRRCAACGAEVECLWRTAKLFTRCV